MTAPETCVACQLTHPEVDAHGIYYCPNPLCTATGAERHRRALKSCDWDLRRSTYTIDVQELYDTYWPDIAKLSPTDPMRLAAERSIARWIERGETIRREEPTLMTYRWRGQEFGTVEELERSVMAVLRNYLHYHHVDQVRVGNAEVNEMLNIEVSVRLVQSRVGT